MKYKNVKTGSIFEVKSELKGNNWVLLDEAPKPKKATKKKKAENELKPEEA